MSGSILIAEIEQKTIIRFKNLDDFQIYVKATNDGCDSEDLIFTGWLCKLNTPESIEVNRS